MRGSGLVVEECPLLLLDPSGPHAAGSPSPRSDRTSAAADDGPRIRTMAADDPDLGAVVSAVGGGIGAAITAALTVDARAHGIRTVFLGAQDDAVARVCERVGFRRVGTACTAEAAPVSG